MPEDLFGHNQFAYCGNNPVVYDDPTGHALDVVFDIISFGLSLKGVLDDPTDPYAWLALGVDALCLALPFMTGGGTAVRALNAMDNALDYARAADRATDAARVANVAADAVTTIGRADDAADAMRAVDAVGGVCFVSGTPILAANGHTPIEEVSVGDLVWANDPITGETALKEVVRTFINETDELIRLRVNGEEVVCTPEHPFYSPVKGWTAAINLRAGDILVTVNGKYVVVEQIQHELLESPITVYNFEVVGFHTYFVGDNSVLVHNMCAMPTPFNESQQIVLEFAKEFKKGISHEDAVALVQLAQEVGINSHLPMIHPNRTGIWSHTLHIKIKNYHIPIFE